VRNPRAPVPRTVVWELTPRCDLDCSHCYNIWTVPGAAKPAELDAAGLRTILGRLKKEAPRLRALTFSGGEPLLRPDLPLTVAETRVHLPRTQISVATNGQRLTSTVAVELADAGVSVVQLTLLAGRPELHDQMVGRAGAFERTLAAISVARTAGLRVVVFFVGTAGNIAEFPSVGALAIAVGADALVFNRFQPGGRGLSDWRNLTPTPAKLDRARRQVAALRKTVDVSLGTIIPPCECPTWSEEDAALTCPIGSRNAYPTIGPDGSLRPCNHTHAVAGSLLTTSLRGLLARSCMTSIDRRVPVECEGCASWRECRGACPAARAVTGEWIYGTANRAAASPEQNARYFLARK